MTPEPTPLRRRKPRSDRRIALAFGILKHRPWCKNCQPHANDVTQALDGKSVDQIGGD